MIEIRQNIVAALTREAMDIDRYDRVQPAYTHADVHRVNLGKVGIPATERTAPAQAFPRQSAQATGGYVPRNNGTRTTRLDTAPRSAAASGQAAPHTAPQYNGSQPVSVPRHAAISSAPHDTAPRHGATQAAAIRIPDLTCRANRGEKRALGLNAGCGVTLDVCFGWNVNDARCDIDASAFLLTDTGRVASNDGFVFYGHTQSSDRAVTFCPTARADRQLVSVDLTRLEPNIKKIVFVLTINEAHEQRLNCGMIRDAYLRVLDHTSGRELVSFMVTEYYENVTSMTMCELYLHNGQWKFNPVGNGVNKDLAGQCMIYGVDIE